MGGLQTPAVPAPPFALTESYWSISPSRPRASLAPAPACRQDEHMRGILWYWNSFPASPQPSRAHTRITSHPPFPLCYFLYNWDYACLLFIYSSVRLRTLFPVGGGYYICKFVPRQIYVHCFDYLKTHASDIRNNLHCMRRFSFVFARAQWCDPKLSIEKETHLNANCFYESKCNCAISTIDGIRNFPTGLRVFLAFYNLKSAQNLG